MATLNQIIYNIRNIIRDNGSDDITVSDRQLEFMINYYRAKLIPQDIDKNRSITSKVIQDLGKITVSKIDRSEDSDTDSHILRTDKVLPKPIELSQKDAFTYIGGIDKQSSIDFVTKRQSYWNKQSKYGSLRPTAYYRNGHIYIEGYPRNIKYINIEGIFENPREVSIFTSGDFDINRDDYPISSKIISTITELVMTKEISWLLQGIPDTVNDSDRGTARPR